MWLMSEVVRDDEVEYKKGEMMMLQRCNLADDVNDMVRWL
jgi:hypothetical protein